MDMGEISDDMRQCLKYFVENNQDGEIIMTLRSIIQILKNVMTSDDISKRTLQLSNKNIRWKLLSPVGAKELMLSLNWKIKDNTFHMETIPENLSEQISILEEELNKTLSRIESYERKPIKVSPQHFNSSVQIESSYRYNVHVSSIKGRRSINEDEVVAVGMGPLIRKNEDFFAVFDGHGGREAAVFAANNLMSKIIRNLSLDGDNAVESIYKAFEETNAWMLTKKFTSGSTAVINYIKDNVIYCANIGDSRCILGCKGKKYLKLTTEHKADLQSEKERIESLGGKVLKKHGIARVNGELTISRAFGNLHLHPYVNSEPSVQIVEMNDDQLFLILASDGLWDEVSSQEVVDIVFDKYEKVPNVAEYLCNYAYLKGSTDNISVIVIFLKDKEEWEDK